MKSIQELEEIRLNHLHDVDQSHNRTTTRIMIGMATCGVAAGAKPVLEQLRQDMKSYPYTDVSIVQTGCIGLCQFEPIVEIIRPGEEKVTYIKVTAEKIRRIFNEHLLNGLPVAEYTMIQDKSGPQTSLFHKQKRIALRNCGMIDPENINEYLAKDGYESLIRVLTQESPQQVVETIIKAGLRGRGGGGFSTGVKWQFAAKQQAPQKYFICNADEGDPGAFMDRSILEGDPHSVLEGMLIGGYAIGANQGYIYVRAEYPLAVKRLNLAIDQARAYGLLGRNILDSEFDFDIEVRLGAGAFVCGEETALMNSIEGKRGMPRPKPPFPAVRGLWGAPSVINNVETLANIPPIIQNGAFWFSQIGTEKSKGTKVFAIGGKIKRPGLAEVAMGISLREVIEEIGGGIPGGKKFKAVQTGGPSGGCITAQHLDAQIDYDTLVSLGSMMGSGGMIVMDEDTCMVDVARFYLEFTKDESCGKCTPCRIGTKRLLEILEKITQGKGSLEDLDELAFLSEQVKAASLCGLGQTAPNPILSTLKYFRDEYLAHVVDKRCPAGVCKSLLHYEIDQELCRGCGLCAKKCPAGAISGVLKQSYLIDQEQCIRCGICQETCRFAAISRN